MAVIVLLTTLRALFVGGLPLPISVFGRSVGSGGSLGSLGGPWGVSRRSWAEKSAAEPGPVDIDFGEPQNRAGIP